MITTSPKTQQSARDITSAWGNYLAQYEWTHFLTLTTASSPGCARLVREFRRLVHRIERIGKSEVRWMYVIENATGRPHIHALLWQERPVAPRTIECEWRLGIAQARQFDSERGGAYYLVKELCADSTDTYDVSSQAPPLIECRGVPPLA
jgi:hypothetical protein